MSQKHKEEPVPTPEPLRQYPLRAGRISRLTGEKISDTKSLREMFADSRSKVKVHSAALWDLHLEALTYRQVKEIAKVLKDSRYVTYQEGDDGRRKI